MDPEQQQLAEEIQQIELVLNSADSFQPQRSQQSTDEEVDSDEEEQLCISTDKGLHNSADLHPTTSTSHNEDLFEQDQDSDGELGDTLETALKLNRAYQELLRYHMANIQELLNRNSEQQRLGQEQLASDIAEKPRKLACYDVMTYPYFKDQWGSGPPKNRDTELRDFVFPAIELPKVWRIYQEELLLKCLEEQMKAKCLKDLHLRLRKCRQGVLERGQQAESEEDLIFTIGCVRSQFSLADVPVEDVVDHADWLTIANHHLQGQFSSESCISLYRNVLNPLVNRSQWSPHEDEKLKQLVEQHGHQQWESIAQELGTDRTAFLCLQRYQQALNDYLTDTWDKEKEDRLYRHVSMNLGKEDVISWDKVAWMVGDMSPLECKNHWEQMSQGGKRMWTHSEDLALIEALKLYSSKFEAKKKWIHVAAHVKTRNSMQCRDRWINQVDNEFSYKPWSYNDNLILFRYLQSYNSDPALVGTKYDIASLREHFPNRANNSLSQRLRIIQTKISKGTIDSFLNSAKAKEDKQRKYDEKRQKRLDRIANSDRIPRSAKTTFKSSLVKETFQRARGTTKEELLSSGVLEEAEVNHCLRQLLAGYPIAVSVSDSVRDSLESCIHLMVGHEDIQLSKLTVKQFLHSRNTLWRRQLQARTRLQEKAVMKRLLSKTRKDMTPHEGPVKMADARSTTAQVEAEIIKILANANNPTKLPDSISTEYSQLIKESMRGSEDLENLRQQYPNGQNLNSDLPYLLPPNQITLNAYYQLMSMRKPLAQYSKELKDSSAVADALKSIKLTDHYQDIANRLMSVMFWPAALGKHNPKAFTPDIMTLRPYKFHPKDDQTKTSDQSVGGPSAAVDGKTSNTCQQKTPVSESRPVAVLPAIINIPVQVQPPSSQAVAGATDKSADVPSTEFSVNASTASGKKLPDDIAIIIFKALQNKKNANDGIAKPVNHVMRKKREGPYDTVILQLAANPSNGASNQSNLKAEVKSQPAKRKLRRILMKKPPEPELKTPPTIQNGESNMAAPPAKRFKSRLKKRVIESTIREETIDQRAGELSPSKSSNGAEGCASSEVAMQSAAGTSDPSKASKAVKARKVNNRTDLASSAPACHQSQRTPKKSTRKQSSPRKSISPSRSCSDVTSKVSPEKLRSVLKQIHMRSSPSKSSVAIENRSCPSTVTRANLLPQLAPDNSRDSGKTVQSASHPGTSIVGDRLGVQAADTEVPGVCNNLGTEGLSQEVLMLKRAVSNPVAHNNEEVQISQEEPRKWCSKRQSSHTNQDEEAVKLSPKKLRKRPHPVEQKETLQLSGESEEDEIDDSDVDEDYRPHDSSRSRSSKRACLF